MDPTRVQLCDSYYYYYFLNPRKTRVGKKIEKIKKNGEANVPSGRPTQN